MISTASRSYLLATESGKSQNTFNFKITELYKNHSNDMADNIAKDFD